MKTTLKAITKSLIFSSPLLLSSLSVHAMDRITLKLAHNLEASHVVSQAIDKLAEEVKKESGGKMRIRIYPGGQMGGPRETLELLQANALDMTKASASEMEPFAKAYSVFSLPYLFTSQADLEKVIYGPVGKEMMNSTADRGFIGLGAYVAGTRSFYAKKPIRTPDDLKGMKIRVVATPTTLKLIELLGGSPTPIPFGEVYTALQQGVIDGAENNEPSYVQTKHVEVAKYYTEDQHTSVPDYFVISTTTWNKLDQEQKDILTQAVKNSEAYEKELWGKAVEESRKIALENGAEFIKVDNTAFKEKLTPLYDDFRKDPEQAEWLDKIEAAVQ